MYSVEQVKAIGKERSAESFSRLLEIFHSDVPIDIKREAVSSIGRHSDNDKVYEFVRREAFNRNNPVSNPTPKGGGFRRSLAFGLTSGLEQKAAAFSRL